MTTHICTDENTFIISTHDGLCFEITFDTNDDEHVEDMLKTLVDWENADIPNNFELIFATKF